MNRKRVQMLRDMLEGIPEKRVRLPHVYLHGASSSNPPKPCGAVACLAGWAWIYPPFIEEGIREMNKLAVYASMDFFEVRQEVFLPADRLEHGTDKQIALARLDALLKGERNGLE